MTSTAQRERLTQIRERATNARTRRAAAQKALDMARERGDQQLQHAAEVAMQQAVGEVDLARDLEAVVLGQMAGVSGGAMFATESLFDDPQTVAMLEQLAHSAMPVGNLALGPIAGRDEVISMIESGNWGPSRRMAASGGYTPTDPSLPDAARLGPYYGIVTQLKRRTRLLDIVPTLPMDGLAFHYAIESGDLDTAWETAEASLKPQGDQVLSDGIVTAVTIAAWQKIRRQQMSDVPTLSLAVSNRLTYSVLRRVESALVAGDGTGDNLTGILNTPGISTVDYSDIPLTDLALAGIGDILSANAEPDAVVVSPADYTTMLAAKAVGSGERLDSSGAFMVPGDQLWGLPLIVSTVLPQGTAIVGDWTLGCALFVREGVLLRVSDSDQDDFVRNVVTMLAEGRFGFACWRPSAFAVVQFASTGGASGGSGPSGSTGP